MFARLRTNFSGSASASYSSLNSDNLANWSGAGKYWKKWNGIKVGHDGGDYPLSIQLNLSLIYFPFPG